MNAARGRGNRCRGSEHWPQRGRPDGTGGAGLEAGQGRRRVAAPRAGEPPELRAAGSGATAPAWPDGIRPAARPDRRCRSAPQGAAAGGATGRRPDPHRGRTRGTLWCHPGRTRTGDNQVVAWRSCQLSYWTGPTGTARTRRSERAPKTARGSGPRRRTTPVARHGPGGSRTPADGMRDRRASGTPRSRCCEPSAPGRSRTATARGREGYGLLGSPMPGRRASKKSGRRDSNPQPPAWHAGARPLSYCRANTGRRVRTSICRIWSPGLCRLSSTRRTSPDRGSRTRASGFRAPRAAGYTRSDGGSRRWATIPRPPLYESGALPLELRRHVCEAARAGFEPAPHRLRAGSSVH
jgi:hypothetical protein